MAEQQQPQKELTDDEALMKIASLMKDNTAAVDEKHNVHVFLQKVVESKDVTRISNLRDDKELNELGVPTHTVRGLKGIELIADKIMDNNTIKDYFAAKANIIMETSLSRTGFLVRQATLQTKQIADVTRKRKINKGWFGGKKIEEQGGDITQPTT